MKAFTCEWRYSFIAEDIDAATEVWQELDDCAEKLGLNCEGGEARELKREHLIPGSPVHKALLDSEAGR